MKPIKNIAILAALILGFLGPVMALYNNDPFGRSTISIYPNPVVYEANISLDKSIDLEANDLTLIFFNIVGEVVHVVESIQIHDFRVDKQVFKRSGIYLFQLKQNGEVVKTGKLNIN